MLARTYAHTLLLLILSLAALSCAATLDQDVATAPLSAEQLLLRKAEILRAEDLRVADQSLLSGLAAQSPELRAMAARAMGRIGEAAFRQPLENRLQDSAVEVRAEAAFALGLIGDSAALPALGRASADEAPAVRRNVASALGLLHDPASSQIIVSLLGDPDPHVVAAACYALPLFDRPGFALDPLSALIDDRGADVGLAALRALAWMASDHTNLGFEERMEARKRLLPFVYSRLGEARSLAALGLEMPVLTEEAELLGLLADEDPDPRVRFNAIRSLSFPGAPVEPFLAKALKSDDDMIVLAAVQGLGRMKGLDALESLARIVVFDSRWWLRKQAIALAGRVNPSRAAAMANGLSKDENPEIREAAAHLLDGRTDELSLSIAERLLADEDMRVRAAAIPAMAGKAGKLSEALGEILNSSETPIRVALAEAAGDRLADSGRSAEEKKEALSILEQLWQVSAEPQDAGLRLAVSNAALRGGTKLPESDMPSERPVAEYGEILSWAAKPRAAIITVERPGFLPAPFTVRLNTSAAPLTSWRFAQLAQEGYYDGQEITRVVPGLVVQSGGDAERRREFSSEISPSSFDPGTLGMISAGPGRALSQWFISLATQPLLAPDQTAFGTVVQNFPGVVSLLLPGDRIVSVKIYEGEGSEQVQLP